MTAALITDNGTQFALTAEDVDRLSRCTKVRQRKSNGGQDFFFLEEELGPGRSRTTLIVANTHSESAAILRHLPHA